MSDDPFPPDASLVTVGAYERLSEARERGLVVAAMDLPHWVVREGPWFTLRVEERARDAVMRELQKFEAEVSSRSTTPAVEPTTIRLRSAPLFIAAWIFSGFWFVQNMLGERWTDDGLADSGKIMRDGEWWRAITALTLHGDFAHFAANLAAGVLFAAFLSMQFGAGASWLAIVMCGVGGNFLNAWFYAADAHRSVGASTAVFGALGILMASDFIARMRTPHSRGRWQLIVPVGAGLGLLAFLGAGDEQHHTDYMAHLWGFCAGAVVGMLMTALPARLIGSRVYQVICGIAAGLLVAIGWLFAVSRTF
jgi:membrane associated rhomboid family serine protease